MKISGLRKNIWQSYLNVPQYFFTLKNIYATGELRKKATTDEFSVVQSEGKRRPNDCLAFPFMPL